MFEKPQRPLRVSIFSDLHGEFVARVQNLGAGSSELLDLVLKEGVKGANRLTHFASIG